MKAPIIAAALFVVFTGSATAEIRYDRKLEAAVLGIVADRIGDLRGPLTFDARLRLPDGVDAMTTNAVAVPAHVQDIEPKKHASSPPSQRSSFTFIPAR
ncbi:MAG: hypothetical protein JNL61_11300 [Rhizobiaceae bacterium]|nr:hypothetical protein [Rhizobiaceae bacterium]